jgi:hypothetical protein
MPPLEVVKAECWDDEVLWMEGVRAAFGLVYQISSSLGAIAAIICLSSISAILDVGNVGQAVGLLNGQGQFEGNDDRGLALK